MTNSKPESGLAGRVAIVTGAATGLGETYARRLAERGAAVVIADVDATGAELVASQIVAAGGQAISQPTDVADRDSVVQMVARTLADFGRLDILVNNAAVLFRFLDRPRKAFWEYSPDEWDLVMAVNVKGPWLCACSAFPNMRERGYGKIVNISSNMAFGTDLISAAQMSAYTTSKAAVIGLTRALAGEAGAYGVRVNAVAPGVVNTETIEQQIGRQRLAEAAQRQAIKQEPTTDDIVGTVLFLCGPESDYVTGQTIVVDGGFMCS